MIRLSGFCSVVFGMALCLMPIKDAHAADVRIGVPNWTSAEMTAHVIKAIAERHLGISVELVVADNNTIYSAMGETGEIDIHPETWLPNHQSYITRYGGEDGPIVLKDGFYSAVQGICVTRDAAENHGVWTIHDLSDPAKAAVFDHNGDSRGELWIGADGWLSTPVEKARAKTYGYSEVLDLVVMDEIDGIRALDAAVTNGEPFVFFCYGPHHIFQLYDLIVLEEPAHDPKRWIMVTPDEADNWLEKSSIDVAWPETRVHMSYVRSLQNRHPALASMIDSMAFNSRQVSAWTYATEVDEIDPAVFAKSWITDNVDLVADWLDNGD